MINFKNLFCVAAIAVTFASCQKDEALLAEQDETISASVVAQIKALGFGTQDIQKIDEGYLVEGDIVLTHNDLNTKADQKLLNVANFEQYRTNNLVSGLPRVIKIGVDSKLGSKYVTCAQAMISRYNAENLQITMQYVTSGANITFVAAPRSAQYLASAGFPTNGNPYGTVKVNAYYLDRNGWDNNSIISIMAHEAGHCIGFRHTDYMDRSYSCGGGYANEGASTVGAVHIPNTPTTADAGSWMLACIGKNVNRPFNNNDKTALNYLY